MSHFRSALILLLVAAPLAMRAQDARDSARKELQPRLVDFASDKMPLDEALKVLSTQTGNTIVDRRSAAHRTNPRLRLQLKGATFWQALDAIVTQAGCGYSAYQEDARLALVDTPLRKAPVAHEGIFRFAIKRVTVTHDAASHFCNVVLEVAWEPRFMPFFLDEGELEASFMAAPFRVKVDGQGKIPVAGHGAIEIPLRLPAPPRKVLELDELKGSITLLGPARMVTFTFANLQPGQAAAQQQDGVQVTLKPGTLKARPWSFDIGIVNPPGGPRLESFNESMWLANNVIALKRTQGGKTETVEHTGEMQETGPVNIDRASLRYYFRDNLPATPADWSLEYRTPGRIVDVTVPFSFKNIPLP